MHAIASLVRSDAVENPAGIGCAPFAVPDICGDAFPSMPKHIHPIRKNVALWISSLKITGLQPRIHHDMQLRLSSHSYRCHYY